MDEIKFYGRGGQGVVMASQMLGFAFFKAGFYPQCFSVFGGERRGAPVVSFLRVDQEQILLKCGIKHPNLMIYLDDSLIDPAEIKSLLSAGGKILINTAQPRTAFKALDQFSVSRIDGRTIAGFGPNHQHRHPRRLLPAIGKAFPGNFAVVDRRNGSGQKNGQSGSCAPGF
jgi:2-oxoacid:acceptor oxidoreductase gamma subunit (pyruvate/2-ketoisovalerate family)